MPVLIVRPENSQLKPEGNALSLAGNIPEPVQQAVIPGGHFVLIDPCPVALAAEAPAVCTDAPGIDRAAVHKDLRAKISLFLKTHLPARR